MRLLQGPHKVAVDYLCFGTQEHGVFLLPQHPSYPRKRMMPSEALIQMALHVEAEKVEVVWVSGNTDVAYNNFES